MLFIELVGGAGALAYELSVSAARDAIPAAAAPTLDILAVSYFPAQYVNRAKEIESAPRTF